MRFGRAKIGLAGQHDRPPSKNYFEPWRTNHGQEMSCRYDYMKISLILMPSCQCLKLVASWHSLIPYLKQKLHVSEVSKKCKKKNCCQELSLVATVTCKIIVNELPVYDFDLSIYILTLQM